MDQQLLGKTALSIELAKKINGQIVSADSMQIYKDMNIGTAKPTEDEMEGIKHYMLDFISPEERYSVSDYKKDAISCIEKILKDGYIPIVVGGTGLYINSLIYGIEYSNINFDEEYRKSLEKKAEQEGLKVLYDMAVKIDEQAMKKISINDKKRIIRVLEIYKQTGKTKTQLEKESVEKPIPYEYKVFGINLDRQVLYNKIEKRVDQMIQNGLIDEVKNILTKYNKFPTAMQGLGYKEVVQYLNGDIKKDEMILKLKQETRRYAKRQLTWFRKYKDIVWLDGQSDIQKNINIILEEI